MNQSDDRIVVTGMGLVAPGAHDLETFWRNLTTGTSAVAPITRFDAGAYPTRVAASVCDEQTRVWPDLDEAWIARGRIASFAAAAARRALRDAQIDPATLAEARVAVSMAAGLGTYEHEEVTSPCVRAALVAPASVPASVAPASAPVLLDWRAFADEYRAVAPPLANERRTPGSISACLARELGARGPVMSAMTACAGSTQAIGDALRWLRLGRADIAIAGGADSELYPMGLASFCLLGALSRRNDNPAAASRPFDARRDGFVIGEGAGVLVLERYRAAVRRGARIYAEVAGFGGACDAYRVTDPHPDGTGAVLAMTRALTSAGLSPDSIGYINAHGTSTMANDRIESLAIGRVFGARASGIPTSSTKSMIGHLTVAAGAVEAIATCLTLVHQRVHPTINLDEPDPLCTLDYVPHHARDARVDAALSNSFAFGGQAASLVLRRVAV